MRTHALLLALFLAACSGATDHSCRCRGDVPGGHLDVACGESACLGGTGYLCVDNGSATEDPSGCGIGAGGQTDLGSDGGAIDLASACTPLTCAQAGARCGYLDDGCGHTLDCGACSGGASCVNNQCRCTPSVTCASKAASCGVVDDGCGKSLNCGGCAAPDTCANNTCACTPATCAAGMCGTIPDGCGKTLDCGGCPTGQSCGGGGAHLCGVAPCTPTTCAQAGKSCGYIDDQCGHSLWCGTCSGTNTCGGGGTANVCGCLPTTCAAQGKGCGMIPDGCGHMLNCGGCSAPESCGGGGAANVCGCAPETDVAFCARLGKSCGQVSATDNCGMPRMVASCGLCAAPQTCGGGGTANVCGCTPESDATFCAAAGKMCGSFTAVDNCGASRTASCGGCPTGQSCGGAGAPNVCGQPLLTGWSWDYPSPNGEGLLAVWPLSSTSVWMVGYAGTIEHWNGSKLSLVASPTTEALDTLFAFSASDIWAAGASGTALHYDGTSWKSVSTGVTDDLSSLWGSSSSDIWCKSGQTGLLHWDGGKWTALDGPIYNVLGGIGGFDQSHVWAVGWDDDSTYGGVRASLYNGATWSAQAAPSNSLSGDSLRDVFMPSATEAWAAGWSYSGTPIVMHWTQAAGWSYGTSPSTIIGGLQHIWGSSASDLWTTSSSNPCVYHGDGATWSCQNPGFMPRDTRGTSASNVWTVGDYGGVARSTGGAFTALTPPPVDCRQASGTGSDLFAACDTGLLHWNGSWSLTPFPIASSERVNAVWAASSTSVWAVTSAGNVLHWNGTSFQTAKTFAGSSLNAVWGTSDQNLWISAYQSLIHLSGTTWSATPVAFEIESFWGASASDIWGAAYTTLQHYDGKSWTQAFQASNGQSVNAVTGTSSTDVWFAGYGTFHWDGSKVTQVDATALSAIWSAGPNDVFGITTTDAYHYDGVSWKALPAPPPWAYYQAVWGDPARDIFLLGEGVVRGK